MEELQNDDESELSCPLEPPVEARVKTPSGWPPQSSVDVECKCD